MIQFGLYALAHYTALLGLVVLAYGLGRALLARVEFQSRLEQFVFSTGLGLGAMALFVFVLGVLGVLYFSVVLVGIAALVAACANLWKELLTGFLRRPWRPSLAGMAIAALLIVVALPLALLPLYPPTAFDAIMYHLPYAKNYVAGHGVSPVLSSRFPVFPQVNEMLFTLSLLLYDDVLAQLTQFLMMALVGVALYAWGSRAYSREVGLWAVGLWLANPIVIRLAGYAFIDIGLVFFATLSAYAFFGGHAKNRLAWTILAGAFAGLAAGSKYSGLFFVAALGVPVLYITLRQRNVRHVTGYALAVLATGAPWYLYNAYYSGNPVFPFLEGLFGEGFWSATDTVYIQGLIDSYGTGRSLGSLIRLPWSLSFGEFPENREISAVYFAALPALLIAAIFRHRTRNLALLSVGFILFWFSTAQVIRYLLAILPVLGLAITALAGSAIARLPLPAGKSRTALAGIGALLLAFPGLQYAARTVRAEGLPPATPDARERYLERKLVSYRTYDYLNASRGSDFKVYALFSENMAYFADGTSMGDWFGPARFSRVTSRLGDGEALYRELRALGADHFLVRTDRTAVSLPDDPFFQSHFKFAYAEPAVQLFELAERPVHRSAGEPLLTNSGFERLEDGWPVGWARNGTPVVDRSGKNSWAGDTAVRCDGTSNVVSQSAAVRGTSAYTLSARARSDQAKGSAWLQLSWQDRQGNILQTHVETIAVDSQWRPYQVLVTAPKAAEAATVYAIAHQGTSLWLDELSLAELRYTQ